jgi:GNAT superfamily N-acetyltransferase
MGAESSPVNFRGEYYTLSPFLIFQADAGHEIPLLCRCPKWKDAAAKNMENRDSPLPATIFHLEMCERGDFLPSKPPSGFGVKEVKPPDPARNRELYRAVGAHWEWTDKLDWSEDDWRKYVCRKEMNTYPGHLDGREIGYFELESQDGGNVEISYFGLFPEQIGKGLGGALLSAALEIAWDFPGTKRVWVHTCTDDHEHALANYLKRGFKVFRTEELS